MNENGARSLRDDWGSVAYHCQEPEGEVYPGERSLKRHHSRRNLAPTLERRLQWVRSSRAPALDPSRVVLRLSHWAAWPQQTGY